MTEVLIQYIQIAADHAPVWGLLIIFVLMTVESSFIPFPSEVVMIPAGFLAARGGLTFGNPAAELSAALLAGLAGSMAGAFINYYLFRWLGRPFLYRYGKRFFLPPSTVMRAEELFLEYGAGATFVCRLLPGIRQIISIPAGLAGMPLGIFSLCTGLGAGLWVAVLGGVGYAFGLHTADLGYSDLVHQGKAAINHNLGWIVLGCVLFFGAYVWLHRKVMHSKRAALVAAAAAAAQSEDVDGQPGS